jgi:hypothetical protein
MSGGRADARRTSTAPTTLGSHARSEDGRRAFNERYLAQWRHGVQAKHARPTHENGSSSKRTTGSSAPSSRRS